MGRGKRGLGDTIRPYGVTGNDGGRNFGGAEDGKYAPAALRWREMGVTEEWNTGVTGKRGTGKQAETA